MTKCKHAGTYTRTNLVHRGAYAGKLRIETICKRCGDVIKVEHR